MRINRSLLPFLGAALITLPALAQPSQPTVPQSPTDAGGWMTQLPPDQWLASRLDGLDVYSSNNGDKIGNISELIFNHSGKVEAVVVGVGSYLRVSKREIALPFDQIEFVNEPRVNATGTTTGEARLAGTSPGGGTVASSAATGTVTVPASATAPAASTMDTNNAPVLSASGALGQVATASSGSPPDHAILMMSITKDELQAAPEFRAPR